VGENSGEIEKEQSLLEMVAYRDILGRGTDSYLHMMYERLTLMKELLSENGVIYVHLGWQVSALVKSLLDDVFGLDKFQNEVIWKRQSAKSGSFDGIGQYGRIHETIFFYSKSGSWKWNQLFTEYDDSYLDSFYKHIEPETERRYRLSDLTAAGTRNGESGSPLLLNGEYVKPAAGRHWALGLKSNESVQDALNRLNSEG